MEHRQDTPKSDNCQQIASERAAREDRKAQLFERRSERCRNKKSEPGILCAPAQLQLSVMQPAVVKAPMFHGGMHDA